MSNELKTDNTMISNGTIIDDVFYPKMNLQSGTIRIVLTTHCNFNCRYCFAEGEHNKKNRVLDLEKVKKVLLVSKEFGINSVKLTGGEPLLYPYLEELLKYIRNINIPYIDLTTNISMLNDKNIEILNKYNVNALTLSLDTLNKTKFSYLTNYNNFALITKNLKNVISKFKGKIRINCIIFDYKFEETDYDQIIELCKKNELGLRFVEPSKVDGLSITYTKNFFDHYLKVLKEKATYVLKSDCQSVEYLFFGNWYLTIMHSLCDNKHCDSCKKYMYIRLSSEMKLKPCLMRTDTEVEVDFTSDKTIKESFIKAIHNMGIGIVDD